MLRYKISQGQNESQQWTFLRALIALTMINRWKDIMSRTETTVWSMRQTSDKGYTCFQKNNDSPTEMMKGWKDWGPKTVLGTSARFIRTVVTVHREDAYSRTEDLIDAISNSSGKNLRA